MPIQRTSGSADARVVVIPGAGHSPYFEEPAAWNRAVADFLGIEIG